MRLIVASVLLAGLCGSIGAAAQDNAAATDGWAQNAGTELRVPVGTVNFIVRSQLGVFGLVDAGRVWFDGRSDGGWHSGVGGGFWLSAFGKSVSVAYARGDGNRLYLKSGLSY